MMNLQSVKLPKLLSVIMIYSELIESVDYSQYEEYNNMSTSQCNTDFSYSGDYNRDAIEDRLLSEMTKLGYEVLGLDFFDMDHAYKKSV